jgi:signal transduction histidine kinase
MAAGLAHEIRNPLGAIKGSAQYLAGSAPAGEPNEFLDIIVEEVDRLNRVVSTFLDYARPSKGNPAPTDVNTAVHKTVQLLGAECERAQVTVTLGLDPAPPPVRIDVEQLRQVLINLVQNAVQAMSAGGDVFIGTGVRERADGRVQVRRWVEIRVTDTGPGIPKTVLANLFVPFVTTKDRGTGLGLAVSQRIVTAAGGRIEARTDSGVGSTFIVRLPVAEDAVVAQGKGAGTSSAAGAMAPVPPAPSEPAPSPPAAAPEGAPSPDGSGAALAGAGDRATTVSTSR